jgi:hypothetical protein
MITILENGMISDSFQMGSEPLIYNDAIVMYQKDYENLSAEEIAEIKQQRYNNWIAIINQPVSEVPTEEPVVQE